MPAPRKEVRKLEIVLSCQHTQIYDIGIPQYGDEVYCRVCQKYVTAIGPIKHYSFRCGECSAGRSYGGDRNSCERAASRHVMSRPQHHVTIWHGDDKITTIAMDESGELPLSGVVERSQQQRRAHQEALRSFLDRQGKP